MNSLPAPLYDASGTRALDAAAIDGHGLPGFTLMRRAAEFSFRELRRRWPHAHRVRVYCGRGNNGGDGYLVAELCARSGLEVDLVAVGEPCGADARRAAAAAAAAGLRPAAEARFDRRTDLVVDALLGTGLDRIPDGETARLIDEINAGGAPVLALDVPSGLNATTGHAPGRVVAADLTCTFIAVKLGLLTGSGPDSSGEIRYDDLGVPAAVFDGVAPVARRICRVDVLAALPRRRRCAHKGDAGHVAIVGGNRGMAGAARIAGEAAARCGAGLVSVMTRAGNGPAVLAGRPELMVIEVDAGAVADRLADRSAVCVGPGLGTDDWAADLLDAALAAGPPVVVDADGLNLLSRLPRRRDDWVLTPHPGEAARLLGCEIAEVAVDRLAAARGIVSRYGGTCVLKGCGTLVATHDRVWLCDLGNPGMASGGMGDCLTGVIVSLLGQGMVPAAAAAAGVWLHAAAADRAAAADGAIGMLAGDLFPHLRRILAEAVDAR